LGWQYSVLVLSGVVYRVISLITLLLLYYAGQTNLNDQINLYSSVYYKHS